MQQQQEKGESNHKIGRIGNLANMEVEGPGPEQFFQVKPESCDRTRTNIDDGV